MAKFLDGNELDEILSEANSPLYFFQKDLNKEAREDFKQFYEKDGSVIVTFTTGIAIIQPNELDLAERNWIPRLKDKDGNPILDRSGNPREAWDKFEAKCKINDSELIYGFGGRSGLLLSAMGKEMKSNNLTNKTLPGTKWKIKCIEAGRFNRWELEYLGKGDVSVKKEKKSNGNDSYEKLLKAVDTMKKNSRTIILKGLDEDEFIEAASFMAHISDKDVKKLIPDLQKNEIININEEGRIFIQ